MGQVSCALTWSYALPENTDNENFGEKVTDLKD